MYKGQRAAEGRRRASEGTDLAGKHEAIAVDELRRIEDNHAIAAAAVATWPQCLW